MWLALGIVYVVWGSTYLAIRVMVETVPPLLGAGLRFGLAGAIMLATLAAVLTVTGSAVCLAAVTTRDRPFLGWVGAVVLATATGLRVLADVRAPEVWTLPAAALLVAAGLWRLRRDPSVGSLDVLGSGVGLALLPSLLLGIIGAALIIAGAGAGKVLSMAGYGSNGHHAQAGSIVDAPDEAGAETIGKS